MAKELIGIEMNFDTQRQIQVGARLTASFVLGFVFLVLDTTLFAWWSFGPLKLMPMIPLVVSAGFRLPMLHGGLLVLFIGYISDVLGAGVVGLQLSAFVVVFIVSVMAENRLEINSWPLQMLAIGAITILFQIVMAVGLKLLDRAYLEPGKFAWVLIAQALLNALTAPMVFGILEYVIQVIKKFWPSSGRSDI